MAAALTDKARKGAPFFKTTLNASMNNSDTSFTLQSATGLPTDTALDFTIDRVDASGTPLSASVREVITGTLTGTTVTTDATRRGLSGTDKRPHAAGAVVEVNFTSDTWNDLIGAYLIAHNQDGTIKTDAVDTAQIKANAVDTAEVKAGAVDGTKLSTGAIYLGSAAKTSNSTTTSATPAAVGISAPVTIPSGGRMVELTFTANSVYGSSAAFITISIWDGTVGSGTQVASFTANPTSAGQQLTANGSVLVAPSAGAKTYNVGMHTSAGTATLVGAATTPAQLIVKLI